MERIDRPMAAFRRPKKPISPRVAKLGSKSVRSRDDKKVVRDIFCGDDSAARHHRRCFRAAQKNRARDRHWSCHRAARDLLHRDLTMSARGKFFAVT
jgi:hypothetical protein